MPGASLTKPQGFMCHRSSYPFASIPAVFQRLMTVGESTTSNCRGGIYDFARIVVQLRAVATLAVSQVTSTIETSSCQVAAVNVRPTSSARRHGKAESVRIVCSAKDLDEPGREGGNVPFQAVPELA